MKALNNTLNWNMIVSLGDLRETFKTTSLIGIVFAMGLVLGITLGAATPTIKGITDNYEVWPGIISVVCFLLLIFLVVIGLPTFHSNHDKQKKTQPSNRRKSYYDHQKLTTRGQRYSSYNRDILMLKLMSKR